MLALREPASSTCTPRQASSHDLYWTTGDGGDQEDPLDRGQDTTNLLGSVIRISVPSDGSGYTVPSGNLAGERPRRCMYAFRYFARAR